MVLFWLVAMVGIVGAVIPRAAHADIIITETGVVTAYFPGPGSSLVNGSLVGQPITLIIDLIPATFSPPVSCSQGELDYIGASNQGSTTISVGGESANENNGYFPYLVLAQPIGSGYSTMGTYSGYDDEAETMISNTVLSATVLAIPNPVTSPDLNFATDISSGTAIYNRGLGACYPINYPNLCEAEI